MNTIEVYGDGATLAMIVSDTLTEFEDDTLTTLGSYAFSCSTALTKLTLSNLESIGDKALNGTTNLTEIRLMNDQVCTYATTSASYAPPNADLRIYVPSSLLASYQAATNWSRLASKFIGV